MDARPGADFMAHMLSLSPAENALLEDDNTFHLVRQPEEMDEGKPKKGSMKYKGMNKAIPEIYLTRLLSVKVQLFMSVVFARVSLVTACYYLESPFFSETTDFQSERFRGTSASSSTECHVKTLHYK